MFQSRTGVVEWPANGFYVVSLAAWHLRDIMSFLDGTMPIRHPSAGPNPPDEPENF
jgi:hypothetical protein